MPLSVGLLGCGTIGNEIAAAFEDGTLPSTLSVIYDRNPERATAIAKRFDSPPTVAEIPEQLYDADIVVEAASQSAVATIAEAVLRSGSDFLPLSVGAFADDRLRKDVVAAVGRPNAGALHLPSGAIAGIDAIKAAAVSGELAEVSLTTTKPPAGLIGAPYLSNHPINLEDLDQPQTVFEGTAKEAASAFPSNINVAMALSFAGLGPDTTTVRIVASPDESQNVHEINAIGEMGVIETTVRNAPSPSNPKTSYLASLSAIEKLRSATANICVGT